MKPKKILKMLFICLIILFSLAYLIEKTGYYEYHLQQKKNLTSEQMKQFEKDVQEGKKVDLNQYLEKTVVDYSSSLTRSATAVSLKVNKTINFFLKDGLKILEKFIK